MSKACQVSEKELLQLALVPAMRRRKSMEHLIEPLNLALDHRPFGASSSPYRNVSTKTALASSSYQKLSAEVPESPCSTPSGSSEKQEDVHTAVSGKSSVSRPELKPQSLKVSVEVKSQVLQEFPLTSEAVRTPLLEHPPTLINPTLTTEENSVSPKVSEPKMEKKIVKLAGVDVSNIAAEEPLKASASSALPIIVAPPRIGIAKGPTNIATRKSTPIPIRPPRRETVRFSISPYQSEEEGPLQTKKDEHAAPSNKGEDLLPDDTQHSDHKEAFESKCKEAPTGIGKLDLE
ncbi:unnamed protein product [Strongylus vulgaris]|uniref:Uncharacterized protein n=1 Tax=Strongylus vulgaris TaxID=40348 RepID=A0A3P7IQV0_STRVU|nr:unnamed protein product [Strongylus vulgaris]